MLEKVLTCQVVN